MPIPDHEHGHRTVAEDRVSTREKVAYGLGGIAENTMHYVVNNMANPVFNVGLGVSPALLGLAMSITRLVDAFVDPVMGVISDRCQSRFGRRRPFIVVGSLVAGLLFALLWAMPRGMSQMAYFWWFLVVCIFFYIAFTVFGIPYLALGYEMSPDYHERTRIMAFRTWFASLGAFAMQWLYWLTQRDVFADTVEGMRWVGMGVGVLLVVFGVAPGLFIKERLLTAAESQQTQHTVKLRTMFSVLKVRPFLLVLGALVAAVLGMFMVTILGFYIDVYYVFGGDERAASVLLGVGGSTYHLVCLASVPFIAWISSHWGKKATLILFLMLAVVGTLAKWVCFNPAQPYLQLVVGVLMAPGFSALWTLLASMMADLTDADELETGSRREGSFGALYNWTLKLGFAVCFFVSGYIIQLSGFDAALGGAQSQQTLFIMRVLFSVIPALGLLVAILLIAKFPITESLAYEIRTKLKAARESR